MASKWNNASLRHIIQSARGQYAAGDLPPEALTDLVLQAVPGKASERKVQMLANAAAGMINSTSRMSEHFV